MPALTQDRLVRKEVALGQIREQARNESLVGLSIAPFKDVQSDDVIFDYIAPDVSGLAPARAEDAESELSQKDDIVGTGRASLIDWAIKDHYSASDVSRYREFERLAELGSGQSFPLTVESMTEDWLTKLAKDTARRRRKLDNRVEWLITQALDTGSIVYNDGKIIFDVDYQRPAGQQDIAPISAVEWDIGDGTHDPIKDFVGVDDFMWDTHGIRMGTVLMSRKAANYILESTQFYVRSGLVAPSGVEPTDIRYAVDGWSTEVAMQAVERATGIKIQIYEGVYRTRALGSSTTVNNRFMKEESAVFLPASQYIAEIDDTEVGFAKTLTSPHPEGNWASGYYEWESSTQDPWGHDTGSGIKAFPVFPHMEFTYVTKLWTP